MGIKIAQNNEELKAHAKFCAKFDEMPDPDKVGQSEYRLVYDYVRELIEDNDFDQGEVVSSLEELKNQVTHFVETLRKA